MKSGIVPHPSREGALTGQKHLVLPALAAIALMLFCTPGAQANLLTNGDFNDPASGAWPVGWQGWSWNTGWANHENTKPGLDGSYCVVVGNNWYDGGGGFYQVVPATEGAQYQLDVMSGADAWWLPTGRMSMIFLDSANSEVGKAERNTVDPKVYGDNYDIAHPWASYSLTGTAPAGATQVKVEFASNNPGGVGGAIWFDNASLVPEPGTLSLIVAGAGILWSNRRRHR